MQDLSYMCGVIAHAPPSRTHKIPQSRQWTFLESTQLSKVFVAVFGLDPPIRLNYTVAGMRAHPKKIANPAASLVVAEIQLPGEKAELIHDYRRYEGGQYFLATGVCSGTGGPPMISFPLKF
jgi:hypothetical protein